MIKNIKRRSINDENATKAGEYFDILTLEAVGKSPESSYRVITKGQNSPVMAVLRIENGEYIICEGSIIENMEVFNKRKNDHLVYGKIKQRKSLFTEDITIGDEHYARVEFDSLPLNKTVAYNLVTGNHYNGDNFHTLNKEAVVRYTAKSTFLGKPVIENGKIIGRVAPKYILLANGEKMSLYEAINEHKMFCGLDPIQEAYYKHW